MRLNDNGVCNLRMVVKKELEDVPKGTKIKLDKEILERLLFDRLVYGKGKGDFVKLPVWSGQFLSKIDLSEIDFEDVSWSLLSDSTLAEKYFSGETLRKYYDVYYNYYQRTVDLNYIIYSGTNAKIDFQKSFEAKNSIDKLARISHCDFSDTDLSNSSINLFEKVYHCLLQNTGLYICRVADLPKNIEIQHVNFSNLDFSAIRVDLTELFNHSFPYNETCIFKYTKLIVVNDIENMIKGGSSVNELKTIKQQFGKEIKSGRLFGCYVNNVGKKGFKEIKSEDQRYKIRKQMAQYYEEYYLDLKSTISSSIQKQIGAIKPNN